MSAHLLLVVVLLACVCGALLAVGVVEYLVWLSERQERGGCDEREGWSGAGSTGAGETLFVEGVGVGDFYRATDDVYRVRLWSEDRLQGGRERLVLHEETARETLLRMLERARGESA